MAIKFVDDDDADDDVNYICAENNLLKYFYLYTSDLHIFSIKNSAMTGL